MIIKLIDKKESAKGALRYARNLAIYMADADPRRLQPDALGLDYGLTLSTYMTRQTGSNDPPRERVLYRAASLRGEAADWDEGMAQMERRLAVRSSRVKKPARHVVLSYRSGEDPNAKQCHQAVAMLAEELGCEAAAILWAAHGDTDNVHIHALFVTVDPYTGAALPFGQGPDGRANHKEAMQRTIARIEHAQKLQAEAGSRYEVQDGHVVRKPERHAPVAKRTPLRQEILASEARSGFASFTRVAQDVAGPILDVASSWPNLHRDLAANGIGIRATRNGGELYADDDHVKLSSVDRRHSWTQLIKPERLGPFVEPQDIDIVPYEPSILDEMKATAWLKRRDIEQALAAQIDQRVAALIAAREAALAEVKASVGAHRDDLAGFDGDPRLRRDIANAWPSLAASAAAAISGAFDARIAAVRALRHAAVTIDDLDALDLDGIGAVDAGIVAPWQHDHGRPPLVAIDGYDAERSGDVVRYWAKGDLTRRGQPAIVDAGAIIWVNDNSDRTVAAALLMGKERYGERHKMIELAIGTLSIDLDGGDVVEVTPPQSWLEDPAEDLSIEIERLTHITSDMLIGKWFPEGEIMHALRGVDVVVAHNAKFDRGFVSSRFPAFANLPWACSMSEVDWPALGFSGGRSIASLLTQGGFFLPDAHRAGADVWATTCLLASATEEGWSAAAHLIHQARRNSHRLYAEDAPFEYKDMLKAAGYRWSPDHRAWWIEGDCERIGNEVAWLRQLSGMIRPKIDKVTWFDRHK